MNLTLHNLSKPLTLAAIVLLVISAVSMILSDLYSPFTTDSYVISDISKISTDIDGVVEHIYVRNGQFVKKGDPLFKIETDELQSKYDTAYANLIILEQNFKKIELEMGLIESEIKQKTEIASNKKQHYMRMKTLLRNKAINQQQYDDAHTAYIDEIREIEQLKIKLQINHVKLGSEQGGNGGLMLGKAILEKARKNLNKATVHAPFDGVITNMQLVKGHFVSKNSPQIVITSQSQKQLVADFNEKGLDLLPNADCLVVFDAIPGRIFKTQVTSIDQAITVTGVGDQKLGETATVAQGDRWVRKSQYVRSTLNMPDVDSSLISGSRATVMVVRDDSKYWNSFSYMTMHIIALFRYLY